MPDAEQQFRSFALMPDAVFPAARNLKSGTDPFPYRFLLSFTLPAVQGSCRLFFPGIIPGEAKHLSLPSESVR